ncbi:MAG: IS91 family transposase [Chitinophagales bacterium]|nr:IS91 family transposase [Chitinophagales bacterium]
MHKPVHELADIIQQYKTSFTQKHQPLKQHVSVLNALEKCRTAALGGHVDQCDGCGHLRISYNSCRNRHCPKCQTTNKERWILARQQQLLPVSYFHVVFTLPQELNTWCLHYPKRMYDLLFAASHQTIRAFAADEKHLGAMSGMISVLHTWGQNLSLHPHVHLIIPGGGIAASGSWKNAKSNGRYLFPVKAMSVVFKNKYMEGLLKFIQTQNKIIEPSLRERLYGKNWVVYAKQPFGGPAQVIEYLGRYTHKVAISNHRIVSIENDKISFRYKDYADGGKQKVMTLEATEFLRRFCLHILPPGFRKIRYYGFMANVNSALLQVQQKEMGIITTRRSDIKKLSWKTIAKQKLNYDADLCPCCKKGKMITILSFDANGPPDAESLKALIELINLPDRQAGGKTA